MLYSFDSHQTNVSQPKKKKLKCFISICQSRKHIWEHKQTKRQDQGQAQVTYQGLIKKMDKTTSSKESQYKKIQLK